MKASTNMVKARHDFFEKNGGNPTIMTVSVVFLDEIIKELSSTTDLSSSTHVLWTLERVESFLNIKLRVDPFISDDTCYFSTE